MVMMRLVMMKETMVAVVMWLIMRVMVVRVKDWFGDMIHQRHQVMMGVGW